MGNYNVRLKLVANEHASEGVTSKVWPLSVTNNHIVIWCLKCSKLKCCI